MEKTILITDWNRDHAKIWFEHVEDNIYTIKASKDYVLEYACQNYDPLPPDSKEYDVEYKMGDGGKVKAHVHSFDPSGGPYISLGTIINGYKVNRIFAKDDFKGVLFALEKIEDK